MLAGCAPGQDDGKAGPCTVSQAAAFALQGDRPLLFVPFSVQGTETQALLDTGAEKTALALSLTSKLDLPDDQRHRTVLAGVGGLGKERQDAMVTQFDFAGFDPGIGHYPVLDDPKGIGKNVTFGGIIGGDTLAHFDLDLDEPHHKLTVYRVSHCQGNFLPWREPYSAVPMDVTWGHRLLVPVRIDGTTFKALLDTGATGTFIDSAAAEKLGVTAEILQHDANGRGSGAAGVDFTGTWHRFSALQIGPDSFPNPGLTVLDRTLHEADLLLGQDYLRLRHVWISYRTGQLFVAQPGARPGG